MTPATPLAIPAIRAVREPAAAPMRTVECLCRTPPEIRGKRLPTDAAIAKELKIGKGTVCGHLRDVALLLDGLEHLERRSRIYLWYWSRKRGGG